MVHGREMSEISFSICQHNFPLLVLMDNLSRIIHPFGGVYDICGLCLRDRSSALNIVRKGFGLHTLNILSH
jgi:hypothetical protein